MKKLSLMLLAASFAVAGTSFAKTTSEGVEESTDPSKAAAIERRAEELQARQPSQQEDTQSAARTKKRQKAKKHMARKAGRAETSSGSSTGTSGTSGNK